MTSATGPRVVTDEKETSVPAKKGKQQQQSDAAAALAIDGATAAAPSTRRRELRRLREGDAFILDINAGDRQCLMHARAGR